MKSKVAAALLVVLASAELARAQVPADQDHPPPVNLNAFAAPVCLSQPCCVYGGLEYLYWWTKATPVPTPLVTTAPATSGSAIPGALGNADTTVLIGGNTVRFVPQSGARATFGVWLDDEQMCAVEATYFVLAPTSRTAPAGSSGLAGSPFLSVPFANISPAGAITESAFAVASPGFFGGSAVLNDSLFLQGAEANGVSNLYCQSNCRFDFLAGFRYVNLVENLDFGTSSVAPGFIDITKDSFRTTNNFYGGQLGFRGQWCWCGFVLGGSAKIAIGDMTEGLAVNGATLSNFVAGLPTATTATTPGGIFTQASNLAVNPHNRFAYVPQADLNIGYQVTPSLRIFAGYSFLYLSQVIRPGDQIDRVINFTQNVPFGAGALTGPARPTLTGFQNTDFWAQGITAGFAFNY